MLIIDDFKKSKKLEESSFNHPILVSKINKMGREKNLQAGEHAAHVAGIIYQITDNVKFDMVNKDEIFKFSQKSKTKVVNLSIGGTDLSTSQESIAFLMDNYKNDFIFVKGLGNDNEKARENILLNYINQNPEIAEKVILVANVMDDAQTISPSSSIPGSDPLIQKLTVAAPETDVWSSVPMQSIDSLKIKHPEKTEEELSTIQQQEMYKANTGTSMAAPVVTGLVVRLLQQYPELSQKEIVEVVRGSCQQTKDAHLLGNGTVDFTKAFELGQKMVQSKTKSADKTMSNKETSADCFKEQAKDLVKKIQNTTTTPPTVIPDKSKTQGASAGFNMGK